MVGKLGKREQVSELTMCCFFQALSFRPLRGLAPLL